MPQSQRHAQRQRIIESLYQVDLGAQEAFESSEIPFIHETLTGIFEHLAEIDAIISESLVGYTLKRLSYVDRAIIRLAVYEMAFTQTPTEIILNEALELTHTYTDLGDQKSVAFNNRLLENIYEALKGKNHG